MNLLANLALPIIIVAIFIFGIWKNVSIFDAFIFGARKGIQTAFGILPTLIALMVCIGMFQASGALDIITYALKPLAGWLHIPEGTLPLALLRPLSGSGSLTIYQNILQQFGPDSLTGRVASVLQGSTETTFYTIAVYYGAIHVRNSRHTVLCSGIGDLTNFLISGWIVQWMFS